MSIAITAIELLALKKLALVSDTLAKSLNDHAAAREQKALTSVLLDVIARAELDHAIGGGAQGLAQPSSSSAYNRSAPDEDPE